MGFPLVRKFWQAGNSVECSVWYLLSTGKQNIELFHFVKGKKHFHYMITKNHERRFHELFYQPQSTKQQHLYTCFRQCGLITQLAILYYLID